jgi:Mg2+ and Co2+ transporter CorA
MLSETIDKIEDKIEKSTTLSDPERKELLAIIAKLESEVGTLPDSQAERAESIKRFAELSAHEATKQEKNPQLLELSLNGLNSSVQEFETDHPELIQAVNSICHMLSNIGI